MTTLRARTPAAPPGDPAFAAIKARVIARTGHDYYRDKDAQLWEKIARRIAVLGLARPADYLALLDDPATGAREWPALESAVTINETFFFRFAEQFVALRRTILPQLIERHAGDKRLRVWSVGCSTGAEAYSVAILIDALLGPRLADWRVSITGTDIDEDALTVARTGLFGRWALRTLGHEERVRYFAAEGDRFRLAARYRSMVRFERHNLMTLTDGTTPLQLADYDLILCRNVLIYFDIGVATRVMAGLVERLAPEGWLLVGHAEPSPAFDAVARGCEVDGVLAYRGSGRVAEAAKPVFESNPIPVRPEPFDAACGDAQDKLRPNGRSRGAGHQTQASSAARPSTSLGTNGFGRERVEIVGLPSTESKLDAVREALALGDTAEANRLADGERALRPTDPVPHYLGALGAMALGDAAATERGFRGAIYLDRGFAMAHYLLGRHLLAIGRGDDARRAFANAAAAVRDLDGETALPEGDGMTAGALTAAVASALDGSSCNGGLSYPVRSR